MSEFPIDRRLLLGGFALAGAAAASASPAQTAATAPSGAFTPKPLPFDPKAVTGLSEKLLVSHHDNNYAGAVKRLSAIRGDIGKLDWATAPGYQVNGLKREELIAWNSMILADGAPLLVLDMYEHAYQMDYGAKAGAYVDAVMKAVSWGHANDAFAHAA